METNRPSRWRPRIRLWHLFALVTLAAVRVWAWPKVGFSVQKVPYVGSRIAVSWNDEPDWELWNTFLP